MIQSDAFFTDGRTAARRPVRVSAGSEALRISTEEGTTLAEWTYPGLRLMEEAHGATAQVRLRHKRGGEAVLTVTDTGFFTELERFTGRRLRSHWLFRPTWPGAAVTLVVIALVVVGAVLVLPRLIDPLAALVPQEWEESLGQRVVETVAGNGSPCEGEAGVAALEALTNRIAPPESRKVALKVRAINHPMINAFAAPGGNIILLNQLIQTAETPEEVAGVLAHEIAHGLERHPLKNLLRALGLQLLIGAITGDMTVVDEAAGEVAALMLVLKYGREAEEAADRIGLEMLNRADIRGDGLASFFKRVRGSTGGAELPALFSTHPPTSERLQTITGQATGTRPALTDTQWKALRAICE